MNDVLEQTRAGVHALSQDDLRQFLMSAYSEYKRLGMVPYSGDASAIDQYTHSSMAGRFAEVLDSVTAQRSSYGNHGLAVTDVEQEFPETTHRVS